MSRLCGHHYDNVASVNVVACEAPRANVDVSICDDLRLGIGQTVQTGWGTEIVHADAATLVSSSSSSADTGWEK
jgi:hypothetical protein